MSSATEPKGASTGSEGLRAAGQAAESKSSRDWDSVEQKCEATRRHWVEVRLVTEEGEGVPDEKCVVTDPDGTEHRVRTDATGLVRIDGLAEGSCEVSFVDLDRGTWQEAR